MGCAHLSQDQRYQIQYLHGGGFSACEIGVKLKHATTTISREIRRNQATRPSTRRGRTATAVRSATSAVLSSV